MLRCAQRLVGDADAEDVLQEALAAAWRSRARFDPARGEPKTWLLAIVANKAKNHRAGSRSGRPLTDADEPSAIGPNSIGALDLQTAMAHLTERQRVALALYYYLDLSTDECSQVMACSSGTVKSTLSTRAAAVAVIVIALAAGVFRNNGRQHDSGPAAGRIVRIVGVVWTDSDSTGTVVYTATTMRLYDGCNSSLSALKVDGRTLSRGHGIGVASSCGGGPLAASAQRRLDHFDKVVAGPATWTRTGDSLLLHTPGAGSVRLTTSGAAAPQVAGPTWRLRMYVDAAGYSHSYHGAATLHVTSGGGFTASDTCRTIHGDADAGAATIDFHPNDGNACRNGNIVSVIDHVLDGSTRFEIRSDELIISKSGGGLLVYGLTR